MQGQRPLDSWGQGKIGLDDPLTTPHTEIMANAKTKTEMKGTTSRWGKRAEIKAASKKARRKADKAAAQEG